MTLTSAQWVLLRNIQLNPNTSRCLTKICLIPRYSHTQPFRRPEAMVESRILTLTLILILTQILVWEALKALLHGPTHECPLTLDLAVLYPTVTVTVTVTVKKPYTLGITATLS